LSASLFAFVFVLHGCSAPDEVSDVVVEPEVADVVEPEVVQVSEADVLRVFGEQTSWEVEVDLEQELLILHFAHPVGLPSLDEPASVLLAIVEEIEVETGILFDLELWAEEGELWISIVDGEIAYMA